MESVGLTIKDLEELDLLMVALLERRDKADKDQAAVIDELLGRLDWDAAGAQLGVA